MTQENQLAVRQEMPFEHMEKLAKAAAASGMFGITKPEQALCLFAICQSEGLDPVSALKRYHLIDGKPSMRSDAMAAEFIAKGGAIIWHARTDEVAAATFFADKSRLTDAARGRSIQRFEKLWDLDLEDDAEKRAAVMGEIVKFSMEGEETIIRTFADAQAKGLTTSFKKNDQGVYEEKEKTNWRQSPRQMLTARVITEGVRLVAPGLIAGVYSPDEIHDIIQAESLEREEFIDDALKGKLDLRDRDSIQRMIDQYVEDAKTSKPSEKSRLLGLASELRTKLADMELEADAIPGIEKASVAAESELSTAAEPELHLSGEPDPVEIDWKDYVLQHVKSKLLRGRKLGSFTGAEIKVIAEKSMQGLDSPDPKIRAEANYIKQADEALNGKKEEK